MPIFISKKTPIVIFFIVVPSLKITGGNREALRLARELDRFGVKSSVLSMWLSPHPMTSPVYVEYLSSWMPKAIRAIFELFIITYRFMKWRSKQENNSNFIFTHYTTLPLAFFVAQSQRFFFVQDLEWKFMGHGKISMLLKLFILKIYQRGKVISANSYLTQMLNQERINIFADASIWADSNFFTPYASQQNREFAMVLRKGDHKRLDLYLRFIDLAISKKHRVAVITQEEDIALHIHDKVDEVLLRPQISQMRDLYARTICFIHLSDHEGFGLPPLEAMGAGCTPVCRDSGGVRAFMLESGLSNLLVPLSVTIEDLFLIAELAVFDTRRFVRRTLVREIFHKGLMRSEYSRNGLISKMLRDRQK